MADRSSLRRRATIYIVQDGLVLVIARWRNGRAYYVIPGGGVEPGESWEEAAIREAREETSLHVALGPVLVEKSWRMDHIEQTERAYLVTAYRGEPMLNDPEILAKSTADNRYELTWLPLQELEAVPCYPPVVGAATIVAALNGSA